MSEKWILIVDDEEGILAVLKSSLKRLGDEYQVVTASNGLAALDHLKKHPFDLVVTDYKMAGMNGLELLEAIHQIHPETRVILMTAYGSPNVEAQAASLNAFRYLKKPLEVDAFRQIVKEATTSSAGVPKQPGPRVLSEKNYREVNQVLMKLQSDIGAHNVFLTDSEGRYVARMGAMEDDRNLARIATLLGGSIVTLIEAGKVIDDNEDAINLIYREGKEENLYVVSSGQQFLITIVIKRGQFSSRLGSVWYSAQNAANALRDIFKKAEYTHPENVFGDNLESAVVDELQKLFSDD